MNTRAARRRMVSRWLIILMLLLALAIAVVGTIFYIERQRVLTKVMRESGVFDPNVAIVLDEESLKINPPITVGESLSRPLWLLNRRPYVEPVVVPVTNTPEQAPVVETPPLDAVLTSVILTATQKVIFLRTPEGSLRLEPGMAYKDWQLTEVSHDHADFQAGDSSTRLELRPFTNKPTSPVRSLGVKQ